MKRGPNVRFEEGINTIFVAQATRIRVPRIYAMYRAGTTNVIVMEEIHGFTLHNVWDRLSPEEKEKVLDQTRDCFA